MSKCFILVIFILSIASYKMLHICLSDQKHDSIKLKWKSKILSFKIEITKNKKSNKK